MKSSKRELREEWAERVWPTLEFWMVRSRLSRRDFDVDALEEIVSKVRCIPTCMSAAYWSDGSAKHFLPLSRNRDALCREAAMLQKKEKTGREVAPAVTGAMRASVPLGRGLLFHRIKTRQHEGGREPFAIDLPVKLAWGLNDPKALESQRQCLVAEFALDHLRYDEFSRLLLPLSVDILGWGRHVRSFAHCLILDSVNRSRPLSALASGGISPYTRASVCMPDASSLTVSAGSVSRQAPC
ncbi:hypothetical protein NOV72_02019 [Caballeronia novacaledonica]|uniref:Uncharacterized protein n=1 Tax=Caballeronia novacaledonica TaxID=1544861 RepID=A0A2U3I3R9_9BURK|nr:hypothetical protein NOV72_02019 [Caballeronia novacaledonica]